MAPVLCSSFPSLAGPTGSSYDPIQDRDHAHFYLLDDDDCLPTSPTTSSRSARSSRSTSLSSCASRLTRRISASTSASSWSGRGLITRGAKKLVGNLVISLFVSSPKRQQPADGQQFRSRPSENEWKRVEEDTAAAKQLQEASVTPFLSRMADGYACFDTTMPWTKSSCAAAPRTSTSRFYEHTEKDDDRHDDDDALVPLFRCPPSRPTTSQGRKLSMAEAWW